MTKNKLQGIKLNESLSCSAWLWKRRDCMFSLEGVFMNETVDYESTQLHSQIPEQQFLL